MNTILVGIGGYGATYGEMLLNNAVPDLNLVAVVDPYAKQSSLYNRFKDIIPIYGRLEEFFAAGQTAELTIISTPIHLHYEQSVAALAGGSHVLC